MTIETFAEYAAGLRGASLPERAVHAARRCTIDWFATALPGAVQPPATLLMSALADELDRGDASVLPTWQRAATRAAALINGTAAHTVEFDDIYRDAIYHPGAPTIAAALAAAEARQVDGDRLVRAIVAGYEVSTRIGEAVTPSHYEYWHTTGTVGCFGAAVAASVVTDLDAGAIRHAMANVATMAAGLQQAFRSDAMTKPLHAGRAAEAGVLCALAAEHGVTGAAGMLDGERGFSRAMADGERFDSVIQDLGERYNIERTTQKNHGCCGHTFAALDAIIALRAEHGIEPERVERIDVATYAKALEITGDRSPRTPYQAKFSLPFCAATAMAEGRVRLDAFSEGRLRDPALRKLMASVEITVDPELEAAFPSRRSATVTIATDDGRTFSRHAPTRKGDPDAPLDDAEIVDKFRELAEPVIGEDAGEHLLERLWRIETLDDVRALAPEGALA